MASDPDADLLDRAEGVDDLLDAQMFGTRETAMLTPNEGTLTLQVPTSHEDDTASQVSLPMSPGDDLQERTAFNAKLLREILRCVTGHSVTMRSRAALKPAPFTGADPARLVILQPTRIAG